MALDGAILGGPTLPQRRHVATVIPGPKSSALLARKAEAVSAAVGTILPAFAVAAGGGTLLDEDGNSFIDLASGIAVTTVGNAHPNIVEAVSEQAARFTHTAFTLMPYEGYVRLCEKLNEITPGSHKKRSALFNSGAEALENAVKFARAYTGKPGIVAFEHAFHGRTNLTMSLTARNSPYKTGFGPLAGDVYRMPTSYPFRDGNHDGVAQATSVIARMETLIGVENLAAMVIEPIQGEGGFIVPAQGFLNTLVEWGRENDVLFIADEVQSGFARTGHMFASEYFGIVPDLITMAKGIAGGLPLSAVTGRAEIMDAPQGGGIGGTYGGNPISCAAALAVIDAIDEEHLLERAREIGDLISTMTETWKSNDSRVGEVRGIGAMMAVEFIDPVTGTPDADLVTRVTKEAAQRGVLLLVAGTDNNVIRFLPALSISNDLLIEAFEVIGGILDEA